MAFIYTFLTEPPFLTAGEAFFHHWTWALGGQAYQQSTPHDLVHASCGDSHGPSNGVAPGGPLRPLRGHCVGLPALLAVRLSTEPDDVDVQLADGIARMP